MRRAAAVLAAAIAWSCAPARAYVFPQEGREPVRGWVRLGTQEWRVRALATRAQRERVFAGRRPRDYPEPLLLVWPRDRYIYLHNDDAAVRFRVVFLTRQRELAGEAILRERDEEGVTSAREAAYALVVPLADSRPEPLPEGQRAVFSASIRQLEPEDELALRVASATLHVTIAADYISQGRGLMYRTALSEDEGVLFAYDREAPRQFWMRHTRIPLSLAYIRADGTISQIVARMEPLDERTVPSREPAKYVLEVNAGWFERHGVREGDRVEIPEFLR